MTSPRPLNGCTTPPPPNASLPDVALSTVNHDLGTIAMPSVSRIQHVARY